MSYHGIPAVRAPHWRWLIIVYFWLGGIAGGASTIASIAHRFAGRSDISRAARYIGFVALVPAPILLVLDLGRPDRFHHMFRILKLRSPMSLGSWALLALAVVTTPLVVVQALSDIRSKSRGSMAAGTRSAKHVRRIPLGLETLNLLAPPLGFFVAGYTGVLLSVSNVPVWARNYLFLGPTFLASGFSSGIAATRLLMRFDRRSSPSSLLALERVESVTLLSELLLLVAGLVRLGRLGRPVTTGFRGMVFWPVTVGLGILVPVVLQATKHGGRSIRTVLAPLLVLTGSFSLRAIMIFAGHESAGRPEDYFEYTRDSRT